MPDAKYQVRALMDRDIKNGIFAVCDVPYCVWGWDIADRNALFIDGIDEEYFRYIAEVHNEHLEGDNSQRAAIALRANYHLCLETLFGLIAAALQAPDCIPGWVLKAKTQQLRNIIKRLQCGTMSFPMKWGFPNKHIGFDDVASLVFRNTSWAKDEKDGTIDRFSTLWHRLSSDFIDANSSNEYNSIKHGFRARAGGFYIQAGVEEVYGKPPPESAMKSLGGSRHGTSFFSAESVQNAPASNKRDPHFTLRRHGLNWLPDNTIGRMILAAMSISNLKSFLMIANGKPPNEIAFHRPLDPKIFDTPWEKSTGVTSMNIDLVVDEKDIYRASGEELARILNDKKINDDLD